MDIHFLRAEVEFFHSQGIKIALDDFGTGNSSLSLALELPFDELKVDMSFIRDIKQKPQNQAMVQSIVDYARRTNTETCIEGIEDTEVSDYIEKFGSTWQQGYYYSKQVPIAARENNRKIIIFFSRMALGATPYFFLNARRKLVRLL